MFPWCWITDRPGLLHTHTDTKRLSEIIYKLNYNRYFIARLPEAPLISFAWWILCSSETHQGHCSSPIQKGLSPHCELSIKSKRSDIWPCTEIHRTVQRDPCRWARQHHLQKSPIPSMRVGVSVSPSNRTLSLIKPPACLTVIRATAGGPVWADKTTLESPTCSSAWFCVEQQHRYISKNLKVWMLKEILIFRKEELEKQEKAFWNQLKLPV